MVIYMMAEEIEQINLAGITNLVNKSYVDSELDFGEIEKLLEESKVVDENDTTDVVKEFIEELNIEEVPKTPPPQPRMEDVEKDLDKTYSNFKAHVVPHVEVIEDDIDLIAMKEEIDDILAVIEEAYPGITDRFGYLEQCTDAREVKNKLEFLRRRYNRVRAQSLGKEIILSGTTIMEQLFDGKREFGPFRPDLTGWTNTIRPKVRRLQNETATIVSDIMDSYQLGPWFRLGIELVPSALLYSRMRKMQYGQRGYTPDMMSEAYNDLREHNPK